MPASLAQDQLYLYFPFKALRLLHVPIETPLKGICIATTQVMYVFRMIFRTKSNSLNNIKQFSFVARNTACFV
jgi:hypothetical protein